MGPSNDAFMIPNRYLPKQEETRPEWFQFFSIHVQTYVLLTKSVAGQHLSGSLGASNETLE